MPITSICWRCGRIYPLADSLAGARGPCGACGADLLIPTSPPLECAACGKDIALESRLNRPGEPAGRLYCQPCFAAKAKPRHARRSPSAAQCQVCHSFHPSSRLIRRANAFICHACHSTDGAGREDRTPQPQKSKRFFGVAAAVLVLLGVPAVLILRHVHNHQAQPSAQPARAAAAFLPQVAASVPPDAQAQLANQTSRVEGLPPVALASPPAGAHVTLPTEVALSVWFSAPPVGVTRVDYFDGKTLVASSTQSPFKVNWKPTDEGRYTLIARAADAAGNTVSSAPVSITLNASTNKPPTVELKQPNNGQPLLGTQENFDLAALAHDPDGFVAKVELFNGDERLGVTSPNEWAGPNEPVHFRLRNFKPGHYTLTAKATDDSGSSVTSEPIELTIKRRPVTARLVAPAQIQLPQRRVELYAEARNPDGQITRVEFYASGALIGTASAKPFRIPWTELKPGTYSLTAKVFSDDDTSIASSPVNVTIHKAPNKPPMVSIREPANQQTFTPTEIPVLAEARDPDGEIARVEFYANGARIGQATTAPYRVMWKDPKPARYMVVAKAYDNENASKDSRPIIITIKQPAQARE